MVLHQSEQLKHYHDTRFENTDTLVVANAMTSYMMQNDCLDRQTDRQTGSGTVIYTIMED